MLLEVKILFWKLYEIHTYSKPIWAQCGTHRYHCAVEGLLSTNCAHVTSVAVCSCKAACISSAFSVFFTAEWRTFWTNRCQILGRWQDEDESLFHIMRALRTRDRGGYLLPAALSPTRSPIGRQSNAYSPLSLATFPSPGNCHWLRCESHATPSTWRWHSSRAHGVSCQLKGVWGVFCDTTERRPSRGHEGASVSEWVSVGKNTCVLAWRTEPRISVPPSTENKVGHENST